MAEVLVSVLVQVVVEKLAGTFLEELGLVRGVKKDLEKLRRKLSNIEKLLKDAEEQQAANKALKACLHELKDVAYDADDILDEFSTEALQQKVEKTETRKRTRDGVLKFFSYSNPIVSNSRTGRQINDILERIDEIWNEMSTFPLKLGFSRVQDEFGKKIETHSFILETEVRERKDEREKIVRMLIDEGNEEDISVIPIFGIGGLGKTTLAQYIYNDERVTGFFDLKMWVCVSEDFDVKKLAGEIVTSATKSDCNLSRMDLLQSELRTILSRRRYLLVLDDVWNENQNKWEDLKILLRGGAVGSKVVVTTRSKMIANIMGTLPAHELDMLPEDDCWLLFKMRAFQSGDEEEFPDLVVIGKAIVEKCKGVPLAAKSLGGLLRFKRSPSDWLAIRDSEIWQLNEDEILPALRLSYVHLPAHLKQCFVYCSIFPKDYLFDKDELIQLWMAEGLLPSGVSRLMEDIGAEYFDELCWRSFFQDVVEFERPRHFVCCKMHDLLNDLARSIAGAECSTLNIGMEENIQESARCSLLVCDYESVSMKSEFFHKAKKLRTFIILGNDAISSYSPRMWGINRPLVPGDIVSFRCLRVLDLKGTGIRELTESIGNLLHLRYLDLSNTPIKRLPSSICILWNLQTLKLLNCLDLLELPKDMRKMISLRHLQVDEAYRFTAMPSKIGRLCYLQTLPFFIIGTEKGCGIEELQGLNHLRGELEIRNLENVIDPVNAQKADLKEKKNLHSLTLMWSKGGCRGVGDTDVIEYLQPHSNLKELRIFNYNGSSFPDRMTGLHLSLLRVLRISNMDNLKQWSNIPEEKVVLPCVEELYIFCCPMLSSLPCLPRLTKLVLKSSNEMLLRSVANCTSLSYLEISSFANIVSLPEGMLQNHNLLRSLCIRFCNQLKSLSKDLNNLASLKQLELLHLPQLNPVPDEMENLTSLKTLKLISCPGIKCLPAGLQHLTSLLRLRIRDCPEIQRRCREEGSEDWHKIQHIPKIDLDDTLFPDLDYVGWASD